MAYDKNVLEKSTARRRAHANLSLKSTKNKVEK